MVSTQTITETIKTHNNKNYSEETVVSKYWTIVDGVGSYKYKTRFNYGCNCTFFNTEAEVFAFMDEIYSVPY